jgi:hypothetical protein
MARILTREEGTRGALHDPRSHGYAVVEGETRDRSAGHGTPTPLGMILEPDAVEELLAAAGWYEDQRGGLGD